MVKTKKHKDKSLSVRSRKIYRGGNGGEWTEPPIEEDENNKDYWDYSGGYLRFFGDGWDKGYRPGGLVLKVDASRYIQLYRQYKSLTRKIWMWKISVNSKLKFYYDKINTCLKKHEDCTEILNDKGCLLAFHHLIQRVGVYDYIAEKLHFAEDNRWVIGAYKWKEYGHWTYINLLDPGKGKYWKQEYGYRNFYYKGSSYNHNFFHRIFKKINKDLIEFVRYHRTASNYIVERFEFNKQKWPKPKKPELAAPEVPDAPKPPPETDPEPRVTDPEPTVTGKEPPEEENVSVENTEGPLYDMPTGEIPDPSTNGPEYQVGFNNEPPTPLTQVEEGEEGGRKSRRRHAKKRKYTRRGRRPPLRKGRTQNK